MTTSKKRTLTAMTQAQEGLPGVKLDKLEPVTINTSNRIFDINTLQMVDQLARIFSQSLLVKPHFRGNVGSQGHANTFIALSMAVELGIPWMMALNQIHVVKGNVGLTGQLYTSLANQRANIKGRIMYREGGEGDNMFCTAYATDKDTNDVVEYTLKIKDIKDTLWFKQDNSGNWKNNTKLMLRYRAAAYLVKTNFPEAMHGIQTTEELIEVHGVKETDMSAVDELNQKVLGNSGKTPEKEDVVSGSEPENEEM